MEAENIEVGTKMNASNHEFQVRLAPKQLELSKYVLTEFPKEFYPTYNRFYLKLVLSKLEKL